MLPVYQQTQICAQNLSHATAQNCALDSNPTPPMRKKPRTILCTHQYHNPPTYRIMYKFVPFSTQGLKTPALQLTRSTMKWARVKMYTDTNGDRVYELIEKGTQITLYREVNGQPLEFNNGEHYEWITFGNKCFNNCAFQSTPYHCLLGLDPRKCEETLGARVFTVEAGTTVWVLVPKK